MTEQQKETSPVAKKKKRGPRLCVLLQDKSSCKKASLFLRMSANGNKQFDIPAKRVDGLVDTFVTMIYLHEGINVALLQLGRTATTFSALQVAPNNHIVDIDRDTLLHIKWGGQLHKIPLTHDKQLIFMLHAPGKGHNCIGLQGSIPQLACPATHKSTMNINNNATVIAVPVQPKEGAVGFKMIRASDHTEKMEWERPIHLNKTVTVTPTSHVDVVVSRWNEPQVFSTFANVTTHGFPVHKSDPTIQAIVEGTMIMYHALVGSDASKDFANDDIENWEQKEKAVGSGSDGEQNPSQDDTVSAANPDDDEEDEEEAKTAAEVSVKATSENALDDYSTGDDYTLEDNLNIVRFGYHALDHESIPGLNDGDSIAAETSPHQSSHREERPTQHQEPVRTTCQSSKDDTPAIIEVTLIGDSLSSSSSTTDAGSTSTPSAAVISTRASTSAPLIAESTAIMSALGDEVKPPADELDKASRSGYDYEPVEYNIPEMLKAEFVGNGDCTLKMDQKVAQADKDAAAPVKKQKKLARMKKFANKRIHLWLLQR